MAHYKTQRQNRVNFLSANHFTPLEARMLSILPRKTPALRAMVVDRVARRERFERIASRKIERGQWRSRDIGQKWINNLSRMYRKRDWRVKHGAVGDQPRMVKGAPNPWASYRSYVRDTGGDGAKNYVSPWELRQISKGKTPLDKGLVFIQKRATSSTVSPVSKPMVADWIGKLDVSIKESRGERRQQLMRQRDRLQRLI